MFFGVSFWRFGLEGKSGTEGGDFTKNFNPIHNDLGVKKNCENLVWPTTPK